MKRLTLVPTPIGNLGDITRRAVEVLSGADLVAAEDTRRSKVLLTHLGIDRKLVRLDAHTMSQRAPGLLAEHQWLAYLTDAGTPGISDPGADLVQLALDAGHEVEVLPGATAFVPALVASGLPTARFTFEGFLPRKGAWRKRRLAQLASAATTSIIYEAPPRLAATLADLAAACGAERRASVSRELSKLHEETRRGTLGELHDHYRGREVKGEIVIVVGPAPAAESDAADEGQPAFVGAELSVPELAARLAAAGVRGRLLRGALEALGVARNVAYQAALEYRNPEHGGDADVSAADDVARVSEPTAAADDEA